jgi:hypothetical protein
MTKKAFLRTLWITTSKQSMATKAKKLAKYGDFQEILSKELPINAARVKFIVLLIQWFAKS